MVRFRVSRDLLALSFFRRDQRRVHGELLAFFDTAAERPGLVEMAMKKNTKGRIDHCDII